MTSVVRRYGRRSRLGEESPNYEPAFRSRESVDSSAVATIPTLAPLILGYLAVVSFPAYLPILLELVRDMD